MRLKSTLDLFSSGRSIAFSGRVCYPNPTLQTEGARGSYQQWCVWKWLISLRKAKAHPLSHCMACPRNSLVPDAPAPGGQSSLRGEGGVSTVTNQGDWWWKGHWDRWQVRPFQPILTSFTSCPLIPIVYQGLTSTLPRRKQGERV